MCIFALQAFWIKNLNLHHLSMKSVGGLILKFVCKVCTSLKGLLHEQLHNKKIKICMAYVKSHSKSTL